MRKSKFAESGILEKLKTLKEKFPDGVAVSRFIALFLKYLSIGIAVVIYISFLVYVILL